VLSWPTPLSRATLLSWATIQDLKYPSFTCNVLISNRTPLGRNFQLHNNTIRSQLQRKFPYVVKETSTAIVLIYFSKFDAQILNTNIQADLHIFTLVPFRDCFNPTDNSISHLARCLTFQIKLLVVTYNKKSSNLHNR